MDKMGFQSLRTKLLGDNINPHERQNHEGKRDIPSGIQQQ